MRSIELFSGCGGLAMGLSIAGFQSAYMAEWDHHSVTNVLHNRDRGIKYVRDWPIHLQDVRLVNWSSYQDIDLLAGGPPCQPFSIGGLHKGHEDYRDMWPEAVRAVREIMPAAFIFENVRGLTRGAFANYLEWIILSLSRPHVERFDGECREDHLNRLRKEQSDVEYRVQVFKVNAADYGAAQKRHRVIFVGIRKDISIAFPSLEQSHSRERLLWDQWITEEYWDRHSIRAPKSGPAKADAGVVRRLKKLEKCPNDSLPWRTVRDVMVGLGEPGDNACPNHILQPGARSYPGHTGSPLDQPSKALKAGVHGVPGGENTMAFSDGSVRYFTVREAARLQGMPDDFKFIGSWTENMRQLGNAVPTQLAEAVAKEVFSVLSAWKQAGRRTAA